MDNIHGYSIDDPNECCTEQSELICSTSNIGHYYLNDPSTHIFVLSDNVTFYDYIMEMGGSI